MRRILKWIGLTLLLLIGVIAFNTMRFTPPQTKVAETALPDVNAMAVAQKLSEAIQFKTISHSLGEPGRPADFKNFLDWLPDAFPNAIGAMSRDTVSGFTPIFLWKGSDTTQKPILITGHYDVVPLESEWSRDPWAGEIAEGFVWGRGALDMKGGLVSFLEAIDRLVAAGYTPKRDIYVALTQDEEIGGLGGAQAVVEYFRSNNIEIDWSLDEGSFVLRDVITSIDKDIASINIAEKGYLTVRISASSEGGHSALPQRDTAVSKLATAITELQEDPIDGGLTGVTYDFFDNLAPHMGLAERVLFANTWLFKPIIEMVLSGTNTTDAMLRTTKAPTMLEGSDAENVLPQTASAVVNFRLHPRDTEADVLRHIEEQIDQEDILVEVLSSKPPSAVSDHTNDAYARLANAAVAVFGDVALVPGLTVGGTDSQYYSTYVGDSYRFLPFIFRSEDIALMHGKDERISVENLGKAVQYYMLVLGDL